MDHDPAVQNLLDRQAITDTLYRYASTIDRKDYEGLRNLLTDDATARFGKRDWIVGGDRIVEWIIDHSSHQAWQHHLLSVYHVDIDGDTASALTYHTSHQTADGHPDAVALIVARYHDELRREGHTWKIVRKDMEIGWRDTQHAVQPER